MADSKPIASVVPGQDSKLAERLLSNVSIDGDCWFWTGRISKNGYGHITIRAGGIRATVRVHRLAYRLFIGDIPSGKLVCHTCDNRRCFNPAHLWAGSQSDNMRDCKNKGRLAPLPRGSSSGSIQHSEEKQGAKLTFVKAQELRQKYVNGATMRSLAEEYGVSVPTVFSIVHWKRYACPPRGKE